MKLSKLSTLLFCLLCSIFLTGCNKDKNKEQQLPVSGEKKESLVSGIVNTEGQEIGEVTLTEGTDGVTIRVVAEQLSPGVHGIHIHETGVCTPPDFESAGAHFNPEGKEHGFENPKGFHLGDLPNIEVNKDGKVEAEVTSAELTLEADQKNSLLDADGSAIVIHEKADDYKTDPAGNSGARIACAAFTK